MRFVGELCERRNKPCFWADNTGRCTWMPSGCETIIENCGTCTNIEQIDGANYCKVFACPRGQWAYGKCQKATHLEEVYIDPRKARKLNPLKSSKRKHKG